MAKERSVNPLGVAVFPSQTKGRPNKSRKSLIECRPAHPKMKHSRDCKQQIYDKAARECKAAGIKGSYIGLAASFLSEIFATYQPAIVGQAINVERSNENGYYERLQDYHLKLQAAFRERTYKTKFRLVYGDIFETLIQEENEGKFSIIDLDMMGSIHLQPMAERAIDAANRAAKKKYQLLLWCPIGLNKVSNARFEKETRPMIVDLIEKHAKIQLHTTDYYLDNKIPVHVDRFILTKRGS